MPTALSPVPAGLRGQLGATGPLLGCSPGQVPGWAPWCSGRGRRRHPMGWKTKQGWDVRGQLLIAMLRLIAGSSIPETLCSKIRVCAKVRLYLYFFSPVPSPFSLPLLAFCLLFYHARALSFQLPWILDRKGIRSPNPPGVPRACMIKPADTSPRVGLTAIPFFAFKFRGPVGSLKAQPQSG